MLEIYGHYGCLKNSVKSSLKVKKAILELTSHVQLSKLSTETLELIDWANRFEKSHVTRAGTEKKTGRRSYFERAPKLISKVRELREQGLTFRKIAQKLFSLGWKTKSGKKFTGGFVCKLNKQADLLGKIGKK